MKNHFLITFSRVAELGGKVVYSVPPSREFRAQTVEGKFCMPATTAGAEQLLASLDMFQGFVAPVFLMITVRV